MSRIRTIKPEFWTSEQVVDCSPVARLLFIGFWNFADDNGVLPASAKRVKMLVCPGDDFSVAQVKGFIDELLRQGLLCEFTGDDGRPYWFATGWRKHQKIEKPSNKYPEPPSCGYQDSPTVRQPFAEDSPTVRQPFAEDSPTVRQPFAEDSPTERKGEEGRGREGKGEERASAPPPPPEPVSAQPRKSAKAPMPECPDWLPADPWRAFVAHRSAQRKPMTPQSAIQTLRDLDKARGYGHDPVELIEVAIAAGWQGCVFPDKHFRPVAAPGGGRRPGDKRETTMARNGDALSAWLGDSVSVSVVPPKEITHATH